MTSYRETSPHLSDTSSIGSPALSGYDPSSDPGSGHLSSANSPAGVEIISSGGPVSPSISVFNVDSTPHFYSSDNPSVDLSPSVGSASPSGSVSVYNLSDVGSEIDFHSPLNLLFSLDPYQYQQQQHQQFSESELRIDGNTSNFSLNNSVQRTELQQHQDAGRPQRQRLPSVTLTPAEEVAPGTPPGSMLFSTSELPVVLGHDIPNLSRHSAMPLTGSSSDQLAMGEMAFFRQMAGYNNDYGMEVINPSTLSGFPSQTNLSPGTIDPLYPGGFPNSADDGRSSSSGYPHLYQPQLPTFEEQAAPSSSTAESSQAQRHTSPEQALQEHTLNDKQKVYQILATSNKLFEVISRVRELVKKKGRPHFNQILDWALRRRVKLTPASEAKAKERRRREANFKCLLCEALLTTNNNLQSKFTLFFSSSKWKFQTNLLS